MSERITVVSWDLDGVVFPRLGIQGGALLAYAQPWSYNKPFKPKHSPIAPQDRLIRPYTPTFLDRVLDTLQLSQLSEIQRHEGRHVKPEVAEIIHRIEADMQFGNTGRPNNERMVGLTIQRLEEGDVHFERVLFKPEKVKSSDESKYWGLIETERELKEQYEKADVAIAVDHWDDNARTIKRLAGKLPHMLFILVQDLTSGILFSREEMKKYPNVARVAIRKTGKIDIVYMSPGFGEFPVVA